MSSSRAWRGLTTTRRSTTSATFGGFHFTRSSEFADVGKLGALGFEVTLCRLPEPDGTGPAQTA